MFAVVVDVAVGQQPAIDEDADVVLFVNVMGPRQR